MEGADYVKCSKDGCVGRKRAAGLCANCYQAKRRADKGDHINALRRSRRRTWTPEQIEANKTAHRKWRSRSSDTIREQNYRQNFGITVSDYNVMFAQQEGKCAVCRSSSSKNRRSPHLYVDHCHKTGKVRGLLCHRCNIALGMLQEDESLFAVATEYLKKHNGST